MQFVGPPFAKEYVKAGRAAVLAYFAEHQIGTDGVIFGHPSVSDGKEERKMRGKPGA